MPQQIDWFASFWRYKKIISYYAGGWGAGKSTGALGFIALAMAVNPGCTGFIIEPTSKMTRDFVNNKFKIAFAEYITGESKQDCEIYLVGGRKVVYLTGHNLEYLEQYEGAWLFADEVALMKSMLIERSVARTRDPNQQRQMIGFAGTPHYGWLKEAFKGENTVDRHIMHVSTDDNYHLTDAVKGAMYRNIPARLRRAYIDGHFTPPGGQVYAEYDKDIHVIPWKYDRNLKTIAINDYSPRNPHVLIVQQLPKGYEVKPGVKLLDTGAVVVGEHYPDGSHAAIRTEALCKGAVALNFKIHEFTDDPSGQSAEATSGIDQTSIAKRVYNCKYRPVRRGRLSRITIGIEHVARLLMPANGQPRLYFSEDVAAAKHSRAICNALPAYSYVPPQDGRPLVEEPIKDGIVDHACDDMRYYAVVYHPITEYVTGHRSRL